MLRTTACIASLVGALVLATPAVAAKGGNGGATNSSSISLALPDAQLTAAAVTDPGYGDSRVVRRLDATRPRIRA